MRIEWRPKAAADLVEIIEYIANESPKAALHVRNEILRQVEYLLTYPAMGRSGRVAGTRELVVAGTPFIVAYRIEGDTLTMLRVLHGARRWPRRL